jgi:2-enoate reductase
MFKDYSILFEPIKIGEMKIKNRIAMAPMGNSGLTTMDGCFSQRAVDYYLERAKGGTGMIITGNAKIENDIERLKPGKLPIPLQNKSNFILTAGEMNERIHSFDTKVVLQIGIGTGRVGGPQLLETHPIAASPIPNYWDTKITCRALSTEEVEILVEKAAQTAFVAAEAGFDGVEIHSLHEGYLLDQFAIAMFNKRNDKYGGDLQCRLRFTLEIIQAIKKKMGPSFPIILRFSVKSFIKDWNKGGLPGEKFIEKGRDLPEALEIAKILEATGADAIDADAGSYEAWYWAHPPGYQEHGCYVPFAEALKSVVNIPVIVTGRLEIPKLAAEVLKEKKADMIGLGRGLLTDPYWPKKVFTGQIENIRPCIGCHDGCLGRMFSGKSVSCTVNPAVGREKQYALTPAEKMKKVSVVGGGIAGMEVARIAAIRGHNVTLYEKSDKLGGQVIAGAIPQFKEDEKRLLDWYKRELRDLKVSIQLNHEVSQEELSQASQDTVIIATGSKPFIPSIPGIENDKVSNAIDILLGKKETGKKIVLIGGGLVGCETALWLAQHGKEITIIEIAENILTRGKPVPYANKQMLQDMLAYNNVRVLTNTSVIEITDKGVTLVDKSFKRGNLEADTVIVATGFTPVQELYDSLRNKIADLYMIGDAKQPLNILSAIWDANEIGRAI